MKSALTPLKVSFITSILENSARIDRRYYLQRLSILAAVVLRGHIDLGHAMYDVINRCRDLPFSYLTQTQV